MPISSLKSKRLKILEGRGTDLGDTNLPSNPATRSTSPRSQEAAALEHAAAAEGQCSQYLIISAIEARNLVAKDYDTHSSDPFVKITLGGVSKKTRAIYRNCHPLWEQKLVFPIDGLSEGEPLLVELFDKDFNSKEFLGQVMMTLGKALEIESDESQRNSYWLVLSKKRSTDIVGGELCLGFERSKMDQQQYAQYMLDLEAQLNSDLLAASCSSKALHIQVKGLNGLAASGLFAGSRGKAGHQQLSLFIKYGRALLEKSLPPPTARHTTEDDPGSSLCPDSYEVVVNEEVIVPLAPAVRATPLVARKKDELYDIKLYLKSQDTLIAKTQIPLASVPFTSSPTGPSHPAIDGSGTCSPPPPAGSITPPPPAAVRLVSEASHRGFDSSEAASYSVSSAPSTPRVTHTQNLPAAYSPCASSSPLSELPDSPMNRSRSDAFGLAALNRRLGALGGWAGSSSNLSSASTASNPSSMASKLAQRTTADSLFSQGGGRPLVEGSLDSVTACSRGQHVTCGMRHAPAGLHGRRVQGLAEMHEGNVLKKPLKAIFIPPREVDRISWAPIKAVEESDELNHTDTHTRPFCRILESTVPMYCNLEVNLHLAVVDLKVAAPDIAGVDMPTGSALVAPDICDDVISDDEEASKATPIQPPDALELLITDTTLQGLGVNRLYTLLISADSAFMQTMYSSANVTEVKVGPWRAAPAGSDYQRVRDVSYTKHLNIPLPLAPEKCHVWEEHRLTREGGGWVLTSVTKNDAPKGDCYEALVQMCGIYVSSHSSRLRVSMQLNWTKSTWGKGMVQGGAETDAKQYYPRMVALLKQQAGSTVSSSDVEPTPMAQGAEDAAAVTARAASSGGWQLHGGRVGVMLHVCMVLSLLVLALAVWSAGRNISSSMRELSAAAAAGQICNTGGQTDSMLPGSL